MASIAEMIQILSAQGTPEAMPLLCRVEQVDKGTRTMRCTPLAGGPELPQVSLQPVQGDGLCTLVAYPAQGATALVLPVMGGSMHIMLSCTHIEQVEMCTTGGVSLSLTTDGHLELNGGSLGGLIKIEDLTNRLNALTDTLNGLVRAYNAHTHAGSTGNQSLPLAIMPPQAAGEDAGEAATFNREDYEDKLITH